MHTVDAVGVDARPAEARGAKRRSVSDISQRGRRVPAAVAREVYLRDQGQCSFVSADGRRCCAREFIELDHIEPWAKSGASSVANLRLRCRAHNQKHARDCFGNAYIEAVDTRARRERRRTSDSNKV